MTAFFVILVFPLIFALLSVTALFVLWWQRRQRHLRPPEEFVLLRAPGESLRKQGDEMLDDLMSWLLIGSVTSVILFFVPVTMKRLLPPSNETVLLSIGVVLFVGAAAMVVRHAVRLGTERRRIFQGYLGERWVGERLQPLSQAGYTVYHDIPICYGEDEAGRANIDHIAVGPRGAVVIETKTYSKPTNHRGGLLQVVFDGDCLCWPRFDNDTKPLWQVKKNAEWLQAFIERQCQLSLPVATVVAIPGWNVKELVLTNPRVVTGNGVADAALHAMKADGPAILTATQIRRVSQALDTLCRDVTT